MIKTCDNPMQLGPDYMRSVEEVQSLAAWLLQQLQPWNADACYCGRGGEALDSKPLHLLQIAGFSYKFQMF